VVPLWCNCSSQTSHCLLFGYGSKKRIGFPLYLVTTSSSATFKFRYVLFFAIMTPLGIVIGTIITELIKEPHNQTESTLVAVLQTLAAGTLLYVAFFEVVLRERARFSGKGLAQLAFVIMGFATMCLVEVFIGGHDHGHTHSERSDIEDTTSSPTTSNTTNLSLLIN